MRQKHGFPFVIAVLANTRAQIFEALRTRTERDTDTELEAALDQIAIITRLRLGRLLGIDRIVVSHGYPPPSPAAPSCRQASRSAAWRPAAAARAERAGGLTTAPVSQINLSPRLTMHAIDTHNGTPGAGMKVQLSMLDGTRLPRAASLRDQPRRTHRRAAADRPELPGRPLRTAAAGRRLFRGARHDAAQAELPAQVPVRFLIANPAERIHLAILFTPWGYSYYRGS